MQAKWEQNTEKTKTKPITHSITPRAAS